MSASEKAFVVAITIGRASFGAILLAFPAFLWWAGQGENDGSIMGVAIIFALFAYPFVVCQAIDDVRSIRERGFWD